MRKKRVFQKGVVVLTIAAVAMSFMLATTGAAIGQSKRELVLWEWHMVEIPDVIGELYKRFEKKHNVKLIISSVDFPALVKKMLLASEAGGLPDVMEFWAQGVVPQLAEKEALVPLDPYIAKEGGEEFLDKWYDWGIPRYKGKIYGLMAYTGISGLWWNKTMFGEVGIDGPPKNWDELVLYAQKLTAPPQQYGLGLNGNDLEALICIAPFIYENLGRVGKIDGKIQVNTAESVEAVQFVLDLINKYKVVPSFTTSDYKRVREMFAAARVAMSSEPGWAFPQILPSKPEGTEWGMALHPKGKVYGAVTGGWDTAFAITTNCKDKDLGWEFVKFMTAEESNYFWMSELPFYNTALKSVAESKVIKESTFLAATTEHLRLGNVHNVYEYLPFQLESALDIFRMEMQSAAVGQKSAQEATDAMAAQWQSLFNEWEKKYGK